MTSTSIVIPASTAIMPVLMNTVPLEIVELVLASLVRPEKDAESLIAALCTSQKQRAAVDSTESK